MTTFAAGRDAMKGQCKEPRESVLECDLARLAWALPPLCNGASPATSDPSGMPNYTGKKTPKNPGQAVELRGLLFGVRWQA